MTAKGQVAVLRSKPLLKEKAAELAREKGIACTPDFAAIGVSRHYLGKLCADGILIRLGYRQYAVAKEAQAYGDTQPA